MIQVRHLLVPLAFAFVSAAPAMAEDGPAWTVVPPANGAGSMSRTLENVTIAYQRVPDDYDTLRITVTACGDSPWSMKDSLDGVSAKSLRDTVAEAFVNARLNCKLPDGFEDRFMAGFDEAFAKVKPFAPPHVQMVGGWKLEDQGSMPGDDSERTLKMTKALATVTMTYQPNARGDEASLSLDCEGSGYGGGLDFDKPGKNHVEIVTAELTDDYADFAKSCKDKAEAPAVLMQDFPEALATIEKWQADKPFVFPPAPSGKQGK